MATASRVADGYKLDYTPSSAVSAGEIVVLGSLVTVADSAIAADELGAVSTCGIWRFSCLTGSTGAQGSAIKYWATTGIASASTGVDLGFLAKARAATDTTVDVLVVPGGN
jgi:predicted RecA/RadA family phage recombinase